MSLQYVRKIRARWTKNSFDYHRVERLKRFVGKLEDNSCMTWYGCVTWQERGRRRSQPALSRWINYILRPPTLVSNYANRWMTTQVARHCSPAEPYAASDKKSHYEKCVQPDTYTDLVLCRKEHTEGGGTTDPDNQPWSPTPQTDG